MPKTIPDTINDWQQHWNQRWEVGQIGFHKSEINAELQKFYPLIKGTGAVFVPLCGKSLDMICITEKGQEVIGVELSPIACEDFFVENKISYERETIPNFVRFKSERITIYCGDYFDLKPEYLRAVTAVYDRAALIALPPDLRNKYIQKERELLDQASQSGINKLLVTLEYAGSPDEGPPFSVTQEEIHSQGAREVQLLQEMLSDFKKSSDDTPITERAYLLRLF